MRMSLRYDARIAMVAGDAQGDGFAILIPGADERAAVASLNDCVRRLRSCSFPGSTTKQA